MKNEILMLFILILNVALSNAQYQKKEIFFDDFDDNRNNWPMKGIDAKSSFSLSYGQYYFEHIRNDKSWITYRTVEINEHKDFEIEANITKISGVINQGFGIVWGREDSNNQFDFNISGNGYYKVNKSYLSKRYDIIGWTKSSYINRGNGATNKLTIKKTGNRITFYVNDNYLAEKDFQSFFGDKLGFVIYHNQKIAIDYFRVSYLEREVYNYPPEIIIIEPELSRGFNVVPEKMIKISGKAQDSDGIYEVTVNGIEAKLQSGGYFSVNLPLAVGDNTITVEAIDTKLKSATKSFLVNREPDKISNSYLSGEKRVALIIGNSEYSGAANLGLNPINDARDIASTLKILGFDIILKTNADLETMNNAIREFGRQNREADVALFYYAGHGMQVERINYLLPIGINIQEKYDVNFECINVSTVQKIMETSNNDRLNLIILDACRNNPFRTWQRGGETGLADMTPPSGTLIAFSTSPGATASNGDGRNGLYTGELIKQLKTPQRIEDVFINTRIEVEKKSGGQQSPWELARLRGKYFLVK